ncbi:MAG: polyhydroxyalkanoate synthesis repressor PhaR [Nitratireductor sp.]|nr:polyhydroxyalkanoate synthesis repressor PhaR [Nitratireductor sp.]
MSSKNQPIMIKKYANRRLYNTGSSTYVTLEDLATMVKAGEEFVVQDAKSGEDITRSVLAQIIFDQEGKEGQNLLPIAFLRQLIKFYGDSMQAMIPSYLEHSMNSFAHEQEKMREQMSKAFGGMGMGNLGSMEEQVHRNMEMFQKAMNMFMPFGAAGAPAEGAQSGGAQSGSAQSGNESAGGKSSEAQAASGQEDTDIKDLKDQLAQLQKRLDKLG